MCSVNICYNSSKMGSSYNSSANVNEKKNERIQLCLRFSLPKQRMRQYVLNLEELIWKMNFRSFASIGY